MKSPNAIRYESRGEPIPRAKAQGILVRLGVSAPEDYLDFIAMHDGATGFCGRAYVIIESLDVVEEMNTAPWEEVPWLVHFGSDGSSTSYAFDKRTVPNPLVAVDMIDREDVRPAGMSLGELFDDLRQQASSWLSDDIVALANQVHSDGQGRPGDLDRFLSVCAQAPSDLRQFMLLADGAEGFVGDGYLSLWPLRDIGDFNSLARTSEFASGMVLIGTDGGTTAYGLDCRGATASFVSAPLVGLFWSRAQDLGPTLEGFLRAIGGGELTPRRRAEVTRLRMNAWEIHPVILGGSPTDHSNKTMVSLPECLRLSAYWNDQIARRTGGTGL